MCTVQYRFNVYGGFSSWNLFKIFNVPWLQCINQAVFDWCKLLISNTTVTCDLKSLTWSIRTILVSASHYELGVLLSVFVVFSFVPLKLHVLLVFRTYNFVEKMECLPLKEMAWRCPLEISQKILWLIMFSAQSP